MRYYTSRQQMYKIQQLCGSMLVTIVTPKIN